jgi:hypothetical protein
MVSAFSCADEMHVPVPETSMHASDSIVRRRAPVGVVLLALLALSCTDATAPDTGNAPMLRRHPGEAVPAQEVGSEAYEFTVPVRGGTFAIGPHLIEFGDKAICDPEHSSYGPSEWDKPCRALDEPITIRATVSVTNGHPRIDFSPELRFTPKKWKRQGVWLYLHDESIEEQGSPEDLRILWAPSDGSALVDEALTDKDVRTKVSKQFKVAFRLIKHFSGYTIDLCRSSREEQ